MQCYRILLLVSVGACAGSGTANLDNFGADEDGGLVLSLDDTGAGIGLDPSEAEALGEAGIEAELTDLTGFEIPEGSLVTLSDTGVSFSANVASLPAAVEVRLPCGAPNLREDGTTDIFSLGDDTLSPVTSFVDCIDGLASFSTRRPGSYVTGLGGSTAAATPTISNPTFNAPAADLDANFPNRFSRITVAPGSRFRPQFIVPFTPSDAAPGLAVLASFEGEVGLDDTTVSAKGSTDLLLFVADLDGELMWYRQLGSAEPETAFGLEANGSGELLVSFNTAGAVRVDGETLFEGGDKTATLTLFGSAGTPRWSRSFPGVAQARVDIALSRSEAWPYIGIAFVTSGAYDLGYGARPSAATWNEQIGDNNSYITHRSDSAIHRGLLLIEDGSNAGHTAIAARGASRAYVALADRGTANPMVVLAGGSPDMLWTNPGTNVTPTCQGDAITYVWTQGNGTNFQKCLNTGTSLDIFEVGAPRFSLYDIAAGADGGVYLVGGTTPGLNSSEDGTIYRLNADQGGIISWSQSIDSPGHDRVNHAYVDSDNRLLASGYFSGAVNLLGGSAAAQGNYGAFGIHFFANGTLAGGITKPAGSISEPTAITYHPEGGLGVSTFVEDSSDLFGIGTLSLINSHAEGVQARGYVGYITF